MHVNKYKVRNIRSIELILILSRKSKSKRGTKRPKRRRRPSITPPVHPKLTNDSKEVLQYISDVQEYMSDLTYNHDGK